MSKRAREVTPPEVNVQLMTTASDTWYVVVNQKLGTFQVLVHIVTVNC